jgi:class 3 adenylate cyclase
VVDRSTQERARRAFDEHAWQDAYEGFATLAGREHVAGEDLERLGEAAWWSAHPAESIDAFEDAHTRYEADGDRRAAARIALRLALEFADRSEWARSNGWVQRAIRLLDGEPECAEQGWLELTLFRSAIERGNVDEAARHATTGQEIGRRLGDRDLQAFALVLQGALLVFQAQVEQGLSMVDEATLAALGGGVAPYAAGGIYCVTISVCRDLADYRRAGEWTEAARTWCERQSITGFPGICSVQRAEILRLHGALDEAEREALTAQAALEAFGRSPQAGAGAEQVGEARLRRGDLAGAEDAFELAHRLGRDPQPGIAMLRLARGDIAGAHASISVALTEREEPLDRARLLPARAEIAVAAHDLTTAREAAEELRAVAGTFHAHVLEAASHQALGAILTQDGKPDEAIHELRAAVRAWSDEDMPFEMAQARCLLATSYRANGDGASAALELQTARATFERIGAQGEVERVDALTAAGELPEVGHRLERTFMFTDIVDSTKLVESMGDEAWEGVLRWHDDALRAEIENHSGEVVHTTGDGFFASFEDVEAAAACAVAMQRHLAAHRREHGFAPRVRIGLHAAEATVIPGDYAGVGVHEAARVAALAEGDEILVTVASVASSAAFAVSNQREVSLKGLAEPVSVATIEWRD